MKRRYGTVGCEFPGCTRRHKANGLCSGHNEQRRVGRELAPLRDPVPFDQAFWSKVRKSDLGCWEWTGATIDGRYGQAWKTGRHILAHRAAWELHFGPVPAGLEVCHSCDNGLCVRPDHLFLGTHQDNMDDMRDKGRSTRGERAGNAKLTAAMVADIRRRFASGESQSAIGRELGIHSSVICRAVNRQRWKHVA